MDSKVLTFMTTAAVSATLAVTGAVEAGPGTSCTCPQGRGWLLFLDSNTRTPDFWKQDEVVVQEISICEHGIQFLFVAEEDGKPFLVALVFSNPRTNTRLSRRPDWIRLCLAYTALRMELNRFLDGALEESGRLDFQNTPLDQRPRIVRPSCRLALIWHERELALRGYLDVYMTELM